MEWNGDLTRKETGPMVNFIGHLKGTRPKHLTLSRFFQRAFAQSIPNKIIKADWERNWDFGLWGNLFRWASRVFQGHLLNQSPNKKSKMIGNGMGIWAIGQISSDIWSVLGQRTVHCQGIFMGFWIIKVPIKQPKLIGYGETFLGIWRALGQWPRILPMNPRIHFFPGFYITRHSNLAEKLQ